MWKQKKKIGKCLPIYLFPISLITLLAGSEIINIKSITKV